MRPEMLRGLAALGVFLALIVSASYLTAYSISPDGYTVAEIERIEENPSPLEGLNISSRATILSVENQGAFYVAEIETASILVFRAGVPPPKRGDTILLRGTCWIESNGSIVVHEFYALDYRGSIIRSVPGILVFVILVFAFFRIDLGRLTFVERESE
jgi:hypothetical protein